MSDFSRDHSDAGTAAGSSHPQPQRGAEALSNFYNRHASERTQEQLVSRHEQRRSSYATTDTSHTNNGHPLEQDHDMDGSVSSRASSLAKGPRVYSSFSAAVAAASRSSLNSRRPSQPLSGTSSPVPSSPRPGSIGANSHRRTVSGGYRFSSGIPGVSMNADAIMDDARSAYHSTGSHEMAHSQSAAHSPPLSPTRGAFDKPIRHSVHGLDSPLRPTPEQIKFANSWLATSPTAARQSQVDTKQPFAPSCEDATTVPVESSPDVNQYSAGKGFGWTPAQANQTNKAVSKARTRANSKPKSRSGSVSKTKAVASGSQTSDPSTNPQRSSSSTQAASSIADELGDPLLSQSNKSDSAFSRFFRRRSKSNSEGKGAPKRSEDATAPPPVPILSQLRRGSNMSDAATEASPLSAESAPLAVISAQKHKDDVPVVTPFPNAFNASAAANTPAMKRLSPEATRSRPMSVESATSGFSEHRKSMSFLASAISTGNPGDLDAEFDSIAESERPDSSAGDAAPAPMPMPTSSSRSSSTRSNLHTSGNHHILPRSGTSSRTPSGSKLLPKSATRDDHVSSILTDFLSLDLEEATRSTKGAPTGASVQAVGQAGLPARSQSVRSVSDTSNLHKNGVDPSGSDVSSMPSTQLAEHHIDTSASVPADRAAQQSPKEEIATQQSSQQDNFPRAIASEKARKVRSHSNLRIVPKDTSREALPRASLSQLATSRPITSRRASANEDEATTPTAANSPGVPAEKSTARAMSFSSRLLRRPKTSSAAAATGSSTSDLLAPPDHGRRRSGAGRASVDDTQARSPNEVEPLTPRDSMSDAHLTAKKNSGATDSSMLETRGGAAALFGTSPARPRTASLLPSFGFGRSRPSPSKSSGNLGSRSSSTVLLQEDAAQVSTPRSEQVSESQDYGLGPGRDSGVSTGSRPSFGRQHSTKTIPADNDEQSSKVEPKFSASAFLPYDDETAEEYAERMAETAPKNQLAALLASSNDEFYTEALQHCMGRFSFNSIPLDIALRKLLMDLHLPKETQQIDRVMEAFAHRYNDCNRGLFTSVDQPYILAFSLMLLHSDAFNKNAKIKMTKSDYLRNTAASGVSNDILEYLYDNLTFTQFIYVEDDDGTSRPATESLGTSASTTNVSAQAPNAANAANRQKLDPYFLIASGRLGELRPDLELLIPEDTPFCNTGSLPSFNVERLNAAFLHAPSIEIVTTKTLAEQSTTSLSANTPVEEEVVSLKVTKVGIVNRKDDVSDGGRKAASRKWKTSGLLLTGSQLLIFKDIVWIDALQSQIVEQVGHSLLNNGVASDEDDSFAADTEEGIVITPRITYFRPDGVISLIDAVAVKENTYGKYNHVFRLVAAKGRQYLVQAQNEDDMNDWIHKINFCATFRTVNVKIRGPDMMPRASTLGGDRGGSRSGSLNRHNHRSGLPSSSSSDADLSAASAGRSAARARISDSDVDLLADTSFDSQGSGSSSRAGSIASGRKSTGFSALQKRANARKEVMTLKIGETEAELERVVKKLQAEIRLARHFAILTPFLKSTREKIELSALPLSERIRTLRLQVAKADSRCKILRLDLAAGEKAVQSMLPTTYLTKSALRLANKGSDSALTGADADTQDERDISASSSQGSNVAGISSATAATINKPASQQRHQMNLNAVSERPADEASSLTTRSQATGGDASLVFSAPTESDLSLDDDHSRRRSTSQAPSLDVIRSGSGRATEADAVSVAQRQTDEVPEDWDLTQVARKGANRISLVNLPSPTELQQATGNKLVFKQTQPSA